MISLTKFSMFALWILTAPVVVPGDIDGWGQWGLAGLVVGFTLYRDWAREKRLSAAIERTDEWTRETLLSALQRNTDALEELKKRPCLAKKVK